MATIITNDENYTEIADAIREKTGGTDVYTPAQMAAAILDIPASGDISALSKNIASMQGALKALNDNAFAISNEYVHDESRLEGSYATIVTHEHNIVYKGIGSGYGGTNTATARYNYPAGELPVSPGDKIYISFKMQSSAPASEMNLYFFSGSKLMVAKNTQAETVYSYREVLTAGDLTRLSFRTVYADRATATDAITMVSEMILVNLTKLYGSGNEVDKDAFCSLISGQYFTDTYYPYPLDVIHAAAQEAKAAAAKAVSATESTAVNLLFAKNPTDPNDGTEFKYTTGTTNVLQWYLQSLISASDHVLYFRAEMMVNEPAGMFVKVGNAKEELTSEEVVPEQWHTLSVAGRNATGVSMQANFVAASFTCKLYRRHIVILDLTDIFGKGREPAASYVDTLLDDKTNYYKKDFNLFSPSCYKAVSAPVLEAPYGGYARPTPDGNIEIGSIPNPDWPGWDEFGTYGQTKKASIPIPILVNSSLLTKGMLVSVPEWGSWSENAVPSGGSEYKGGHVFHGWSTDLLHRLTMLVNMYRDDEGAIFYYIPGDKASGGEGMFLRMRVGADNMGKGFLIDNIYDGNSFQFSRGTIFGRLNIQSKPCPWDKNGKGQASGLPHNAVPASATADGLKGDIAVDENYLYYCYDDNLWKRIAWETW